MPSGTELLLIFGIVVLLFGAKKIPELAKGIGKGIKNFKEEMKDTEEPKEVASSETKQVESTANESSAATQEKTTTQA